LIVYIDASALVKRYVAEIGTEAVEELLASAELAGTSLISRAEVSAAICKAVRVGAVGRDPASNAVRLFRSHWPALFRLEIDAALVDKADVLAWEHNLRGYDAVHLACALVWQASLAESVTLATFDQELWEAAREAGMDVWPASPGLKRPILQNSLTGRPASR
jgi:predicted nucleic acid-binding protein